MCLRQRFRGGQVDVRRTVDHEIALLREHRQPGERYDGYDLARAGAVAPEISSLSESNALGALIKNQDARLTINSRANPRRCV